MHAQDGQKYCYDAKYAKDKSKYKVSLLVWVKNSKKLSRKGSKLEKNWLEPYRICEVTKELLDSATAIITQQYWQLHST